MTDVVSLIHACCSKGKTNISYSRVIDEVLPARDTIKIITFARDQNPPEMWDALNNDTTGAVSLGYF